MIYSNIGNNNRMDLNVYHVRSNTKCMHIPINKGKYVIFGCKNFKKLKLDDFAK